MPSMYEQIMDHYFQATPEQIEAGTRWYAEAGDFVERVSRHYDVPVVRVAAVVAHLSPRTQWAQNLAYAETLIATGTCPGLGSNRERAKAALVADDPMATFSPKAYKTRAFIANILGDYEPVTVDVWAARAVGTDPAHMSSEVMYRAVERCYKAAAITLGLEPAVLQAIVWVVVKANHKRGRVYHD